MSHMIFEKTDREMTQADYDEEDRLIEEEDAEWEALSFWGKFRAAGYNPLCLLFDFQSPAWAFGSNGVGALTLVLHQYFCSHTSDFR